MTSKFTREELLNIIETDHVQCGEASALAHMALAAMDSEPVFTLEVARADYKGQKLGNQFGFITLDAERNLKEGSYQLYRHAQPSPVVPDAYVRDERGRMMLNGVCEPKIGFSAGWNACRSAMLQESQKSAGASNNCRSSENVQVVQDVSRCSTKAAPALDSPPKTAESRGGNSPVIPDGWVACSERLPDETQPVITVSDGGIVQQTVYQFCEGVWSDWYEQYDDVTADAFTHWMPLPAAPQEVKGE